MTIAASGSISMGGSVVDRSVNLEIRRSATSTVDLNDGDVRSLANISFGTIAISNFYGKSFFTFGQDEYSTPGTYNWICPDGVTSVSVVCIGGGGGGDAGSDIIGVGGGGGGGALAYRNNITVVPGQTYTIVVGSGGLSHSVLNGITVVDPTDGGATGAFSCIAGGGSKGSRTVGGAIGIGIGSFSATGGTISGVFSGGASGGAGGTVDTSSLGFRVPGGGGGAGYLGSGGAGARGARQSGSPSSASGFSGAPGAGGGAGGGGSGYSGDTVRVNTGGNGGGAGIYGQGSSGEGGAGGSLFNPVSDGEAGSGGTYGSGGSGGIGGDTRNARAGVSGAVRIIWPGFIRQFPTTQTENA